MIKNCLSKSVMPFSTGALIGIMTALLDKWFSPKNYKEDYFIGHKVTQFALFCIIKVYG